MRIPLPKVTNSPGEVKAHVFPIQIAHQTLELMQASLFYAILADEAAGQRIRQPNALNEIQASLLRAGLEKDVWEDGWKYLEKYKSLVERTVTQNALVALRSQWDWYIRNLGAFVESSIQAAGQKQLSKRQHEDLDRIGFKDILMQLSILEDVADVAFKISAAVKASVREMSLVRNLGLHNRWEVDAYYLGKTQSAGWENRHVRFFEIPELQEWHGALVSVVNATWSPIAQQFKNAPPFTLDD